MESPGRFDGLQARHKPAKLLFFFCCGFCLLNAVNKRAREAFSLLRLLHDRKRARDRPNPQTRVKSAAAYYARAIWPNPIRGLQGAHARKGRFLTFCALFICCGYNYTPGHKISPQRAKKEGAFWRSLFFLCAAAFILRLA